MFWGALALFVKSADEDVITTAIIMIEEGSWQMSVWLQNKALEAKSRIISSYEYYYGGVEMRSRVFEAYLFTPSGEWVATPTIENLPITLSASHKAGSLGLYRSST